MMDTACTNRLISIHDVSGRLVTAGRIASDCIDRAGRDFLDPTKPFYQRSIDLIEAQRHANGLLCRFREAGSVTNALGVYAARTTFRILHFDLHFGAAGGEEEIDKTRIQRVFERQFQRESLETFVIWWNRVSQRES